jgi:ABC-type antimicrobial peptide transport system permease subunit
MIGGLYRSAFEADTAQALSSLGVAVRSTTGEASVVAAARAIVREFDPELPLIDVRSAQAALDNSTASRRTIAFVFAAFGAIALALALGGIYAVLSYVVGRRRQEIGIRMALGARRGQVLRLVVQQGLRLVAIGVLLGLPISLLALRELSSLLVGVTPRDPLTYAVAIVLLAATAAVSALIPARRAAGVDPKTALGEG